MTGMSEKGSGCPADEEFVFAKHYDCPVCEEKFENPTVKSSKARMVGSDMDLRPIYGNVDTLKYDVILCPECGYTALERYFSKISSVQKKLIIEKVATAYQPREEKETFSYEDAFFRYKMALVNSIAKQAYDSEKAYICLKTGWLLRSWRESLEGTGQEAKQEKLEQQENEFLKNAKNGFIQANLKESYPICGMDENTVDYLVSALEMRFGEYEEAIKRLSGIIASRVANRRIKDRARDLKDEIMKLREG